MWNKIVNPKTGRKVNVNSKIGKSVLRNYMNQLGGVELDFNKYTIDSLIQKCNETLFLLKKLQQKNINMTELNEIVSTLEIIKKIKKFKHLTNGLNIFINRLKSSFTQTGGAEATSVNNGTNDLCIEVNRADIGADEQCPICFDTLLSDELPIWKCANRRVEHRFHMKCIIDWIYTQINQMEHRRLADVKCPLCLEQFYTDAMIMNIMDSNRPEEPNLGGPDCACSMCYIVGIAKNTASFMPLLLYLYIFYFKDYLRQLI